MSKPIRKVFVAVPSKDDSIRVGIWQVVLHETMDMLVQDIVPSFMGYGQLNPTHAARNRAVAEFVASDCDDLIFLDDDVLPERGAMIRLLKHDGDFVAGITPYKRDEMGFPFRLRPGVTDLRTDPATGLISDQFEGVPFGMVRLSRRCCERMIEAYGHLRYESVQIPGGAWRLFSYDLVPRPGDGVLEERSEDFMFGKRWCDIGGSIHVDPNITFAHIGMKMYGGNFDVWARQHPEMSKFYNVGDLPQQSAA